MKKKKVIQYSAVDGKPIRVFDCIREAQDKYHITHISSVCRYQRETDGGYVWRYADEEEPEMSKRVPKKPVRVYNTVR